MNREQVIKQVVREVAKELSLMALMVDDNNGDTLVELYLEYAKKVLTLIEQAGYRLVPELLVIDGGLISDAMERGFTTKVEADNLTDEINMKHFASAIEVAKAQRDYDLQQIGEANGH